MTSPHVLATEPPPALISDPVEAAKAARLRYVNDTRPGIRRERVGEAWRYYTAKGEPVEDPKTLARITALAIPPAWTDVWICPVANGHIQATGRDAKGRKQYRYHARWRAVRDETKYGRMLVFGQALPPIRAHVMQDLARPGLPREKVLATVVRLLETTRIRIGNEEYARANQSFGLTTLRTRHVTVSGTTLRFTFRGKSGKDHSIRISDRRLARIVKRCQELPGQELFAYLDAEGQPQTIDSADVNDYLRGISGQDFTAKDFRTWAGTVLATRELAAAGPSESATQAKKTVVAVIQTVAEQLGNTPAVCRKCYVHPAILAAYQDGSMFAALAEPQSTGDTAALEPEEIAVLALLEHGLVAEHA